MVAIALASNGHVIFRVRMAQSQVGVLPRIRFRERDQLRLQLGNVPRPQRLRHGFDKGLDELQPARVCHRHPQRVDSQPGGGDNSCRFATSSELYVAAPSVRPGRLPPDGIDRYKYRKHFSKTTKACVSQRPTRA